MTAPKIHLDGIAYAAYFLIKAGTLIGIHVFFTL